MYDIIIIGAGPAGLTSAIYASRSENKVLVLEESNYGGQIINASKIENYPGEINISGYDLVTNMYNQALQLGSEIKNEKVLDIIDKNEYKEIITNENKYKTLSVIIASGASNRKLNISNEKELIGKGISYCATCDGAFYKNKTVAVIGGGNTAINEAIYLSDMCKQVYLIHRNSCFKAMEKYVETLKKKNNVKIILNSNIIKINGIDKLESIETNKEKIDIDGLFIAIGREPEVSYDSIDIELDNNGYIISNDKCNTNIDGVFVAGDVRKKEVRQLVTATSDGAIAALNAIKYVKKNKSSN